MGKSALVFGAGGFIGAHLVKRLKAEGYYVKGVDLKLPEYSTSPADEFVIGDLRSQEFCKVVIDRKYDRIYQMAADMGGAGYIFTGESDADIMSNSAIINLNVLDIVKRIGVGILFYPSSACIYPEQNQLDPLNPNCEESSAYPANPDSEYGWEKLFSERLYLSFHKNYNINIRIARFHNIYGPEGAWAGGKEKAPAALCRKVVEAQNNSTVEIWGDGNQTRSFLYIDDCIEGVQRLMDSNFIGPVNIGSDEMVSINDLAKLIISISGKNLALKHISGPLGVRGRNSDNTLIKSRLHWAPTSLLRNGMDSTYQWISKEIQKK
jgi:nucleoside-diphosphate-sugar epimerase